MVSFWVMVYGNFTLKACWTYININLKLIIFKIAALLNGKTFLCKLVGMESIRHIDGLEEVQLYFLSVPSGSHFVYSDM